MSGQKNIHTPYHAYTSSKCFCVRSVPIHIVSFIRRSSSWVPSANDVIEHRGPARIAYHKFCGTSNDPQEESPKVEKLGFSNVTKPSSGVDVPIKPRMVIMTPHTSLIPRMLFRLTFPSPLRAVPPIPLLYHRCYRKSFLPRIDS